jgi:hypothetical protein
MLPEEGEAEKSAGAAVSSGEPDLSASPGAPSRGVTWRAVLLGLLLIPLATRWLVQIEYIRYSDTPTIPALFFHCVAALVLLVGLNGIVRRVWPKVAFSSVELLTVYTMIVIGSNLCGHDVLQILFTTIVWLVPRSTAENHWADLIQPNVPKILLPKPGPALDYLFLGNSDLYSTGYWKIWLVPLGIWTLFVLMLAGTMFCVASLLRKQWDHERLTYPLQEIPLAIAQPGGALFRQPLFWIGAGLAAGIQFLNLAHILWPVVPSIPLAPQYFTAPSLPWSAAGSIPICYYPFAVGITFLLPTQLAFSCWFFFVFTRLELVATAAMGFQMTGDSFPYIAQQSGGAYLGFAVFSLYAARHHLAAAYRQAVHGDGEDDSGEPLSYRVAFAGTVLGSAGLLLFLVAMGMRWFVAGAYLILFFGLVLCVSRLRSEVGLPSIELYQRGADDMLLRTFGGSAFTRRELSAESLLFFMNRTHRQFPMMHHFDQLRVGKRSGADLRRYAGVILLATVAGTVCAFWSLLHELYRLGLASAHMTGPAGWAFGNDPWNRLASWINSPEPRDLGAVAAYGVGFAVTGLLAWLRTTFLWWPLHPAGYVVGSSFALMRLWLPLFASWLLKSLILRYGGLSGYRKALPFFLGLVVGEFTAGFIRTILDLSFGLYLPVDSGIGGL